MSTSTNEIFELAADIVRHTSQSVFLTGKAGTGKTTFLHYIKEHTDKNVIVAAPTGVAAINAGGTTLHSLLQLPFEPFIPNFEGKKKLDYHFKLRKSKIEMLRELDLLIIDEVSMLRADVLDAIDYMLRKYRNNQQPFGGVQILFIGDMFQLPPVVQPSEWEQLKHYYPSPFFFHAQALENYPFLYIELKTIYRQQDQQFIDILNRIRNNNTNSQDLEILNKRYNPSFQLPEENRYIVLCTHNYKADRINSHELSKLGGKERVFKGEVRGDFSENALPTEHDLTLKEGSQVMFVRNDAGEKRRYYNGKLATISHLAKTKIIVRFENGDEMELEYETWRNVRYTLNAESGEIEEEELGSFTQYPIRLAWAITIHKSQGLTFNRIVIDAGQAFAAGQVYVALSRCTSLDGIILFSKITPQSISTDEHAIDFAKKEQNLSHLSKMLELEKPRYCAEQLKKQFDWSPFIRCLRSLNELATEKKIPEKEKVLIMTARLCSKGVEQQEIATNFTKELDRLLNCSIPDLDKLKERVEKAALYFHKDVQECIIVPITEHLNEYKNKSKIKLYLKTASEIHTTLLSQLSKIEHIKYGNIDLTANLTFNKYTPSEEVDPSSKSEKTGRALKGDSQRITLNLFTEGKSIPEIASERNLSERTVESHLSSFILTGEISIERLIGEDKIKSLISVLNKMSSEETISSIKKNLPEEYSFFDIIAVANHIKYCKANNKQP